MRHLAGKSFLSMIIIVLMLLSPSPAGSFQAGGTWGADVRLTDNPYISKTTYNFERNIAADELGNVHAVFMDDRTGQVQIYYTRSTDNGLSWSTETRLSATFMNQGAPSIATSGSNVFVVWHDFRNLNFDIYFRRSSNYGNSWSNPARLTSNPNHSQFPVIAASDSDLHVVWIDNRDGNNEIYYRSSGNNGQSWGREQLLSETPFDSFTPTITCFGTVVYAFWVDTRDGNEEEYCRISTNRGKTWGAPKQLTNDPASSWAPSAVAQDASTLHLVWFDNRDNNTFGIYYLRSTDGGATWEPDTRLSSMSSYSQERPTLAAYGDELYLVWDDYRHVPEGNWGSEIYYLHSPDRGVTWDPEVRLTTAQGESLWPHIAATSGYLHVLWHDARDLNAEMYYKRFVK